MDTAPAVARHPSGLESVGVLGRLEVAGPEHDVEDAVRHIGVGVCWDQWFPASARIMALRGAELLFYPTGIGTDDHWQRAMQGRAAANLMPLIAANRVGTETGDLGTTHFWGALSSRVAGPRGEIVAKADGSDETVITTTFDLAAIAEMRAKWGGFRDRRPDLYCPLSVDGQRVVATD